MAGHLWVTLALLIGSLVGMYLYARWVHRNPSEFESAYAELHRATRECADAIGRELQPILTKAAGAMTEVVERHRLG